MSTGAHESRWARIRVAGQMRARGLAVGDSHSPLARGFKHRLSDFKMIPYGICQISAVVSPTGCVYSKYSCLGIAKRVLFLFSLTR